MSTRKEFPELWIRKRKNYNSKNVVLVSYFQGKYSFADHGQYYGGNYFSSPVPRRDINTRDILQMASNRTRRYHHHNLVVPEIRLNGNVLTSIEM